MTPLNAGILAAGISGLVGIFRDRQPDRLVVSMFIVFCLVYGLYKCLAVCARGGKK